MSVPDGLDVLLICIICALLGVIIQSRSQMLFSVFQIYFFISSGILGVLLLHLVIFIYFQIEK